MRLLAAILVATAAASASAAASSGVRSASTVVTSRVSSSGRYAVVAKLRTRHSTSELVTLYVPGASARRIRAYRTRTVHASYSINLGQGKLSVRAAAKGPAVRLSVSLTRVGALVAGPPPPAPVTPAPQPSSGSTASTGPTGATGTTSSPPPPVPPPGGPPASSPYQNVVWSDDFVADYNSGMTEPNPAYWSYDNWGGCGNSTQSTNVKAVANTHLTPQGLAITAISDGAGGYTSAQLDTTGNVSIPNGAYIAASIALPSGQGLCPAFWMLGDRPAAGTSFPGEIDVVEAPSFDGANLPQTAASPMFVVHGPVNGSSVQEWLRAGSPRPWNPTQFNTYGVLWTGSAITWYVNNVALATFTRSDVPAGGTWSSFLTSFHILLDLAVGSWPGPSAVPSATMFVHWVKVYG